MNRRTFFYTSGLITAAVLLQGSRLAERFDRPVGARFQGLHYRGDLNGVISVSADQGKTWQVHTNLGSAYRILAFELGQGGKLNCVVGFGDWQFPLVLSASRKNWQSLV
jgi:hypothetical protein